MSWKWPNNGSRMNREVHVRFWESPEVKVLRATRQQRLRRQSTGASVVPQIVTTLVHRASRWAIDRHNQQLSMISSVRGSPDEPWMKQIARNVTIEGWGALRDCRYLLHDRDSKFTRSFRAIIASGRVEPLALPVRSPDLNAYSERWVRSVKEVLVQGVSHRRALLAAGAERICRALPCGA